MNHGTHRLCNEKKIGYSLYFNNFLPLLHSTSVITQEVQSIRKVSEEIGLVQQSSRVFKGHLFSKKKNFFIKLNYIEAAHFTESILKEIFRKHVLASRNSHLEVFCENQVAECFLKHYLYFEQIQIQKQKLFNDVLHSDFHISNEILTENSENCLRNKLK